MTRRRRRIEKRPRRCPSCGVVDYWELPDGSASCGFCGFEERASVLDVERRERDRRRGR